jgi:Delta7-sterol 5-desaturase
VFENFTLWLASLSGQNLINLWIGLFLVATLVAGVASGFFKARKIQPNGFKWSIFRFEAMVAVIATVISGFLLQGLGSVLNLVQPIVIDPAPIPWWRVGLEYAAYFLLFDTWFYWFHRLMHKEPVYSLVHKLHHKSTSPNMLTTLSVNPLESLVNGGFVPVLLTLATLVGLPLHAASVALFGVTTIAMGLYVHSGYEFLPRWWNKTWATKWFITTTFHDQHHKYFNYNFGGYTPIWDYLCGTVRKKYEADFDRICERRSAPRRSSPPEAEPAQV